MGGTHHRLSIFCRKAQKDGATLWPHPACCTTHTLTPWNYMLAQRLRGNTLDDWYPCHFPLGTSWVTAMSAQGRVFLRTSNNSLGCLRKVRNKFATETDPQTLGWFGTTLCPDTLPDMIPSCSRGWHPPSKRFPTPYVKGARAFTSV